MVFSSWLKKLTLGKWKIDIDEKPNLERIKKEKILFILLLKKEINKK